MRGSVDVGSADLWRPPLPLTSYRSSKWYGPPFFADIGSATPGSGGMDAVMFVVEKATSFDIIAARVNTLAAGSNLRYGIYRGDGDGDGPGSLFAELGTVLSDTVGEKELAISVTLPRGIWWPACATQGGAPVMRGFTSAMPMIGGQASSVILGTSPPATFTQGGVTGALPDPWGALVGAGVAVCIAMRAT